MRRGWAGAGLTARLLAGGVLATSGYLKLMSPAEEFALVIESYRILPIHVALYAARVIPWVEFFAGTSLLFGYFTRFSAVCATALFSMFLTALTSAALRGIALSDCGCFGQGGPHLSQPQAMVLDGLLVALSLAAFLSRSSRFSLDALLTKDR